MIRPNLIDGNMGLFGIDCALAVNSVDSKGC